MAAKTWDTDFRYQAIQESMKRIRSESTDDIFRSKSSFCIPVANRPIVGWTPGKLFLVFLVLGFVLLIAAAIVVGVAGRNPNLGDNSKTMAIVLSVTMGLGGMTCFFVPVLFDRLLMRLLIGSRGSELVSQPGEVLCAEISNNDRSKMKVSIDGDDYVLFLADTKNQRLLIEGVAARYMIRAEDVTELKPFQFMNYVGAEIVFRINDSVCLGLAIARVSVLLELIRQLPILFFLEKRIKNRIFKACQEALGDGEMMDSYD
jgi:hypothetical protein